mmetsp:Transcript_41928/g.82467  ORF Transcript_41928/g.82467 Transcript_41928/m.82467 type:complete len:268 (-) Transcript_41928:92-895(-)
MHQEFVRMKATLDAFPHDAFGWGILGALHMNTHKLLENVLLEAEHYLGYALTFGGAAAVFAESNLEGCYAKRQLEAAKFIWMEGMEACIGGIAALAVGVEVLAEDSGGAMAIGVDGTDANSTSDFLFVRAELLFERAAAKKMGWGWGVNNGEIFLGRATAMLLQRDASVDRRVAACELVGMAADRNARLPWTLYLQTFCENEVDNDAKMQLLRVFTTDMMKRALEMAQPKLRANHLPLLPFQSATRAGPLKSQRPPGQLKYSHEMLP